MLAEALIRSSSFRTLHLKNITEAIPTFFFLKRWCLHYRSSVETLEGFCYPTDGLRFCVETICDTYVDDCLARRPQAINLADLWVQTAECHSIFTYEKSQIFVDPSSGSLRLRVNNGGLECFASGSISLEWHLAYEFEITSNRGQYT